MFKILKFLVIKQGKYLMWLFYLWKKLFFYPFQFDIEVWLTELPFRFSWIVPEEYVWLKEVEVTRWKVHIGTLLNPWKMYSLLFLQIGVLSCDISSETIKNGGTSFFELALLSLIKLNLITLISIHVFGNCSWKL